jgi:hypothetical protein
MCRRGYAHAGRRQGLSRAVPVHRHDQQIDDQAGTGTIAIGRAGGNDGEEALIGRGPAWQTTQAGRAVAALSSWRARGRWLQSAS